MIESEMKFHVTYPLSTYRKKSTGLTSPLACSTKPMMIEKLTVPTGTHKIPSAVPS